MERERWLDGKRLANSMAVRSRVANPMAVRDGVHNPTLIHAMKSDYWHKGHTL